MMLVAALMPALAGPNTAMVGFTGQPDHLVTAAEQLGASTRACYQAAAFCVFDFPADPPLDQLSVVAGVRYAEADQRLPDPWQAIAPDAAGTDDCDDQWELLAVGAEEAWATADGTWGPVIAVADSGFLTSHEELSGKISGQFDYGNGDTLPQVEWASGVPAHGTFIAALAAGHGDNGVGRAGLAPGARLNLLKIADDDGALYFSYAASALADVADGDLGIRVVNYSIASGSTTSSFSDAVDALATVDVVLVAAAGNCTSAHCSDADNDADPLYPASFSADHVISVAGSTRDGGFNSYSHYGARSVDLAAPGVDLCSAAVDDDHDYYVSAGTSYAAPLVAATVALLLEAHADLTTTELARVLRASAAEHPEWLGRTRSGGVLDAAAALDTAVPRLSEPSDSTVDGTGRLDLQLANSGAVGDAVVVLWHGDGIDVVGASVDWTVTPFVDGDPLELPDAGGVVAGGAGTLVTGRLDAHSATTLSLDLAGRVLGTTQASARLVLSSGGADYLNAPYDEGDSDPTGFLAYDFDVQVTAVASDDDTGVDSGVGDGGTGDAGTDDGSTGEPGLADDEGGSGEAPTGKQGCSSAGGIAGTFWLPLALLLSRRRHCPRSCCMVSLLP